MKMATSSGRCSVEPPLFGPHSSQDPIKNLYPMVNEEETPLPRCWSSKDKYGFLGLSQNNLRVHYKGKLLDCGLCLCCYFDSLEFLYVIEPVSRNKISIASAA